MQALTLKNRWYSRSAEELALNILPKDNDPNSRAYIKYVPMGEIGVVRSDGEKFAIGTTELYHCLGIALYDIQSKVGGVAHVRLYEKRDGRWKLDLGSLHATTEKLVSLTNSQGGSLFQAFIINLPSVQRNDSDNRALCSAIERIMKEKQIPIQSFYSGYLPMEFKLDTKTGLITPFWN